MKKKILNPYTFERITRAFESSICLLLYTYFNLDDSEIAFQFGLIAVFSGIVAFPSSMLCAQNYALSSGDDIIQKFVAKRCLMVLFVSPVFLFAGGDWAALLVLASQSLMGVMSFAIVSPYYLVLARKVVWWTVASIVIQVFLVTFGFSFEFLFVTRTISYVLTFIIILHSLVGRFNFKENGLLSPISFKDIELYIANIFYSSSQNLDYLYVSTNFPDHAAMYLAIRRSFEIANPLISWWGMRLPRYFVDGSNFLTIFKAGFFPIFALTVLFLLGLVSVHIWIFETFLYIPFAFLGLIFFLDNWLSKLFIYIGNIHTEIVRVSLRAACMLLLVYYIMPPFNIVPICVISISLIGYIPYIWVKLKK